MKSRGLNGVYGIDAPYVPAIFGIVGVVCLSLGVLSSGGEGLWILLAIFFLLQAAIYLHTTLRGKFLLWRHVVQDVQLPESPRVLDVGCGRGMAIITTLTQFPTAQGMALDLWRSRDQSGNDPKTTMANAEANGVVDRLQLLTEDMVALSIPDNTFDFSFAYVSIQNIKNKDARSTAISEIVRVTKPGGVIRIVDMQYVHQYAATLDGLGAKDVTVRSLGWNGWFGNPFYACKLVTATKPA